MPATLTGVIFDQSTIFSRANDQEFLVEMRSLLINLKDSNIKIGVFSTNPLNLQPLLQQYKLPPFDLLLTKKETGKNKGAKEWIQTAARFFNCKHHQLLYIGDEKRDWLTAINSGTIYLHAHWTNTSPAGVTAFIAPSPSVVWNFVTHYLIPPPRWEYTLDIPERLLCVRSLLGASVVLPATNPPSFKLQKIFTYGDQVDVNNHPAQNPLMIHAVSSLYLEGLIEFGSLFAVYPSSTPNKISPVLQKFLEPAAKVFHGYFKEDLLIRGAQGLDTSLERAQGRKSNVTFANQTNTVYLNPVYEAKIKGHTVIVFDDFTTSGMSLEWARNLLEAAGASRIILLTIGKYGTTHTIYVPFLSGLISPFELKQYDAARQFGTVREVMNHNLSAQELVKKSFEHLKNGLPLPYP